MAARALPPLLVTIGDGVDAANDVGGDSRDGSTGSCWCCSDTAVNSRGTLTPVDGEVSEELDSDAVGARDDASSRFSCCT